MAAVHLTKVENNFEQIKIDSVEHCKYLPTDLYKRSDTDNFFYVNSKL